MADKLDLALNSSTVSPNVGTNSMDVELKERHACAAEAPAEVILSRKRKSEKMETDEVVKRPNFPPISADKLTVFSFKICFR